MVHILLLRAKNIIKKVLNSIIVKKASTIIGTTVVLNLALTLFGFAFSAWTLLGSLGLYFVYEEVMSDMKTIARSIKK